jgi:hypothetical protein
MGVKMSTSYAIETIGPRTADRAYPLARVGGFALSLDDWRAFCRLLGSPPVGDRTGRELAVVARNTSGYVKGLCVYSIKHLSPHGRLVDVPIFVVASAADEEGVATELIGFLGSECKKSACAGIRFRCVEPDPRARRLTREATEQTDGGVFLPAGASVAEIAKAICAHSISDMASIDQLCR